MIQHNEFSEITDLAQLEDIEDELLAQEEDVELSDAVKEKLIHLYNRMWELHPDGERYEPSISKLLLGLGWDYKRSQVKYDKARKYFEELIRLKRPSVVPVAHYRLGFIHYHNKNWDKAISHFRFALAPHSRNKLEAWAALENSQKFKANVRLALACKYKSIEVAQEAQAIFEHCSALDEASHLYMQELESEVLIEEQSPYLCITCSEVKKMNDREFRLLKESDHAVVLDYTDYSRKYLYVAGIPYPIIGRNLQIMRELLLSSEPVPQSRFEDQMEMSQVSVYMNRLRAFLQRCGITSEAIVANNGYKWIHPNTYLIYRSDDPDYMF